MANRTVSVRLQAEIGQYVSSMSKAAGATMRVGDSAVASGSKAKGGFDIAGKGALLMGGAVVAGLGMAVGASMKFEAAMSAAATATQVTGAALNDLREAAMKAGADTQYSATEAAQAITEMGKAGVSTSDILGGGLDGALALAAAGQIEVGRAAELASVAMTQFNLTGEDLPHVADLLAAGAGKAMGSVDDLGAALNQSGLIAAAAGLNIEETTGTLAAFASAGLVGSDAGTSFKTMLQALQAPSGKSAELMAELGINMYDANGNMLGASEMAGVLQSSLSGLTEEQRNAALAQIFGTDAVRAANVLYKEGAAGIDEWTAKVNDQGYAAETAAALNDNLKGDLERLGGAFDTLMIQVGSGAQGPLRELVQMFTGILDVAGGVLSFWGDLPGEVQAAVGIFAALTALKGPLDDVLGSAAGVIMRAQIRFSEAAAGTSGLAAAAGTARGAIAGLVRAAAPLAGIMVLTSAISSVVEFTRAGDDARESTRLFNGSLKDLGNTARGEAVATEINKIRDSIVGYQEFIDGYEGQNLFNKYVWSGIGEPGELKNADESIAALEEQLSNLERTSGSLANNTDVLAERFRLSKTEVQELADKYGIDLSESVFLAQLRFGAMYSEEYGTTPTDATNALTGALASAKAQTEEAIAAQEKWLESLQETAAGFVDPLAAYSGLLDAKTAKERESAEATAAATDSATDSWEDYADDVTVSLDELATRLEEQLLAQDNWRANIGAITQRGGLEVGQILAAMGEEGVQLAAQMANGTDAEFNRMADLLIEDARRGGAGAAAEFDYYMKMMQLVGASGGKATADEVAKALGIGVAEVERIAGQYGVVLGKGIAPILNSLGLDDLQVQSLTRPFGDYAEGGYTGPGGKYQPAGIVHAGEYVLTQEQVEALGIDAIEAFANRGYASGGFVTAADVPLPPSTAPYRPPISTAGDATMRKGYDEVTGYLKAVAALAPAPGATGPIGSGAAGGSWQALWARVHAAFPTARMTSNYRAGDPGYHGKGKAVDVAGARPGDAAAMLSINRWAAGAMGANLSQLIHTPGINLLNGKPHTYNAATRADHYDHVHMATYDQGGPLHPGYTLAYNGTGKTEWVSKEMGGAGGGGGSVVVHSTVNFTGPVYGGEAMKRIAVEVIEARDKQLTISGRSV